VEVSEWVAAPFFLVLFLFRLILIFPTTLDLMDAMDPMDDPVACEPEICAIEPDLPRHLQKRHEIGILRN
jgi:hypothetical protein